MTPAVDRLYRWSPLLAFLLALGLALARVPVLPALDLAASDLPPARRQAELSRAAEQLPAITEPERQATLTRWPDGRLAVAWRAPSQEDPRDPAIWLSLRQRDGRWSTAREIANRGSAAGGAFAQVRSLSSPQLHAEGSWLQLWFIGHALGDWGGASLYHSTSTDGGQTWSTTRRLPLGAGLRFGHVRLDPPLPLADGGLLLPFADTLAGPTTRWLRWSATGRLVDQGSIDADDGRFRGDSRSTEVPR